jgi:pimeloyl-ACP methyl ester carboxylesterase
VSAAKPAPVPFALRVSAAGARALATVSVPWAARLGLALFCTPLPPKWVVQRKLARFSPPAQMQTQRLPFGGHALTLYHWPANAGAPRALLTHGWAGAARQFVPMANALAAAGWNVTVIDHVAHGQSPGLQGNLPMFIRALDYTVQHIGPLDLVVGHSMGAGAAANAITRGLHAKRFVSIASPASFGDVLAGYTRWLRLPDQVRAQIQVLLETRSGMRFAALDAQHNAPRLALPTLIVHDEGDKTVAFANAQQLAALAPNARLMATQGLGHNRILSDTAVIEAVLAFAQAEKTPN